MPDANDTAQPEDPPVVTVGRRPAAWVLFAAVVLAFLAGDLWLKAWSFEHIAGVPLRVTAGDDGPRVYVPEGTELRSIDGTVLVPEPDAAGGGWVLAPRAKDAHPASAIPRHEPTELVPGLLDLQLTLNTGAVFGLGQGARWLFVAVSVLATGVILVLVWRSPARARVYHTALGMILAGALGNLYDRVRFSAVRDMLHMLPETGLWPWIFNLADVALVVGVCVVLVLSFFDGRGRAPA
jgi:signal peptidase II